MPKTSSETTMSERLARKSEWLSRMPFLVGAILFHVILFVLLATWVIFRAPVDKPDATTFSPVKIAIPPPPPPPAPPQSLGGEAQSALEPSVTVTPPPAIPHVTMTHNASPFTLSATALPQPSLTSTAPATGTGLANTGATGTGLGVGSVFGSDNNNGNGMTGYFYDLKQAPDHTPTGMDIDKERVVLKKFFAGGWNEDEWAAKYLKSPKPLYANELLVPITSSADGPKAYGLDKVCAMGYWAAIYHLKINCSRTGNYRLAGYGDDYLVVRVNGHVVLDSGYYAPVTTFKREKVYPANWMKYKSDHSDYMHTVMGSSFHMDTGAEMTMDVLLGDAFPADGAGKVGYFLLLIEEGKEYPKDALGDPIFPLLQVQADPKVTRKGEYPPFSVNPEEALLP
jgi:hypothetical protein